MLLFISTLYPCMVRHRRLIGTTFNPRILGNAGMSAERRQIPNQVCCQEDFLSPLSALKKDVEHSVIGRREIVE